MKKATFLFVIATLLTGSLAFGQQDTLRLFGNQKPKEKTEEPRVERNGDVFNGNDGIRTLTGPGRRLGFYFGFSTGYMQVDGYDAFSAGATLAMIANHGLAIGFTGKGFFSEPHKLNSGSNTSYNYAGGYGGFLIEPIILPKSPVHISFPILLGGGGISYNKLTDLDYPYEYTDVYIEDTDAFLIAEPGIELEMNVVRWMRVGVGGSYRFTTSLGPENFDSDLLNGLSAGLSLKFGMF